ncbi:aldo/keto reductase [Aneurinibacillus aneurinilyticus]|nr:aldo/keto reductase [Aneurinibacillus aneurinilyticus]MED0668748.1 aldo/keto reductase [Aneurinibacillus aneurinilyticus]
MHSISDCAVLHNGVRMPWLGLGVYKTQDGEEVEQAVKAAVEAGYRSIDTASLYHNERGVGKAIQACGIPREDLFITTKIWNSNQGYDSTLYAFEESLKKLGLEYLDLYLIHWPVKEKYKETWRAMEKLYKDGLVRAIGVSNFHVHHLEDLLTSAHIIPMVNQVEFHPRLTQKTLLIFCKEKGIQLEAWSPLMRGRLLDEPMLNNIARKHGKTPVQVILRWDLQHEVVTIPKSVHAERIVANADIFDFTLSDEEMRQIDALNRNERSGQDPDHFHFDF